MQFFLGGLAVIVFLLLSCVVFATGLVLGGYFLLLYVSDTQFQELIELRKTARK